MYPCSEQGWEMRLLRRISKDGNFCPSLVPVLFLTTLMVKIFSLVPNRNFPSPAHASSFSSCPCVPLQGDWACFTFCIPALKGRQGAPPAVINTLRWPPSPSGLWFFLPREGREPELQRGRSMDQGILLH